VLPSVQPSNHPLTFSPHPVYYGTTFFQQSGISQPFLITIITNIVNVLSTPLSFYTIERFGRRSLLIYGAFLMLVCEFIIALVGTFAPASNAASKVLIAFVCVYIFAFASTWGPAAWVIIGELFPLPIRAKGVALSTASNWFWNCVIGVVTPYMVDAGQGNLKSKVFFVWGSTCCLCLLFAVFFVPETKGLSLEQVDRMMEETTPRSSAWWVPHSTYAQEAETAKEGGVGTGAGAGIGPGSEAANGVGVAAEHEEKVDHSVSVAAERV
jgi:MFS family permease